MQIAEKKAKLADEWVMSNMDRARYDKMRKSLNAEEARLKAIRSHIDPSQAEELNRTRAQLKVWKNVLGEMTWNLEDEDGKAVRLVDQPHSIAKTAVRLSDDAFAEYVGFPTSPRAFLDLLQSRLVVFNDRIEVNALVPVQPIGCQKCTSASRGEGKCF